MFENKIIYSDFGSFTGFSFLLAIAPASGDEADSDLIFCSFMDNVDYVFALIVSSHPYCARHVMHRTRAKY